MEILPVLCIYGMMIVGVIFSLSISFQLEQRRSDPGGLIVGVNFPSDRFDIYGFNKDCNPVWSCGLSRRRSLKFNIGAEHRCADEIDLGNAR